MSENHHTAEILSVKQRPLQNTCCKCRIRSHHKCLALFPYTLFLNIRSKDKPILYMMYVAIIYTSVQIKIIINYSVAKNGIHIKENVLVCIYLRIWLDDIDHTEGYNTNHMEWAHPDKFELRNCILLHIRPGDSRCR